MSETLMHWPRPNICRECMRGFPHHDFDDLNKIIDQAKEIEKLKEELADLTRLSDKQSTQFHQLRERHDSLNALVGDLRVAIKNLPDGEHIFKELLDKAKAQTGAV